MGGSAYGLTMLSPVRPDSDTISPLAALSSVLARLPQGAGSPMATVPGTHFARWITLSRLPYEGPPAQPDALRSAYLLFVADFDGDLDSFVNGLATHAPDFVDAIWQHCVAYPGAARPDALRAYVRRCQVPSTFLFGAYPSTPLPVVLRALATQRALSDFVAANAQKRGADLQAAFAQFRRRLAAAPPPRPGSL
jgi:hypothetical protein